MPRLSIIVPHRGDDSRLETTLLSILENRPVDCEIIVVHDGRYQDPYDLAEEVLFVEEDPGTSPTRLLNAGVLAACSPVVNVVIDGITVGEHWCEPALAALGDRHLAAASIPVQDGERFCHGIIASTRASARNLIRGEVLQRKSVEHVAGPSIACGFYQRKNLLMIGGWNESLSMEAADVELAWLMQALGMHCASTSADEAVCYASSPRSQQASTISELAEIAVAFGISADGVAAASIDFLRSLLAGQSSYGLAWARGLMGGKLTNSIARRMLQAQQRLDDSKEQSATPELKIFGGASSAEISRAA